MPELLYINSAHPRFHSPKLNLFTIDCNPGDQPMQPALQ